MGSMSLKICRKGFSTYMARSVCSSGNLPRSVCSSGNLPRSVCSSGNLPRSVCINHHHHHLLSWSSSCFGNNGVSVVGGGGRGMSTMTQPPWLMLPPHVNDDQAVKALFFKFYSLEEKRVVSVPVDSSALGRSSDSESLSLLSKHFMTDEMWFVGSSHGWLAMCDASDDKYDVFLFNPLSGRRIQLPTARDLPVPGEHFSPSVLKVILSSSPDEDGCCALMCYGADCRPVFCRPGQSTEWTLIGGPDYANRTEDFVYSTKLGTFFCVNRGGDFEVLDLNSNPPTRTKLEMEVDEENYPYWPSKDFHSAEGKRFKEMSYLVAVGPPGDFFLVHRHVAVSVGPDGEHVVCGGQGGYPYQTKAFYVYRFEYCEDGSSGKARVRYVEDGNLDGLALFVGINHSFAVASQCGGGVLRPNSIYFTDGGVHFPYAYYREPSLGFGGHDIGVYNYQDRTFEPCYYPRDVRSIQNITPKPIWFTPSIGSGN